MPLEELHALAQAIDGLDYPSESDEPFEVFCWSDALGTGPTSAKGVVASHAGTGRSIEEVPVDHFFTELEGADDAPAFIALRKALESTLSDLRIFRVGAGEVRVDVYLVGRTHLGEWGGVRTVSIET